MILDYKESVKLLQSQSKFYINPGIERVKKILEILSNPQDKIKIIHVAGTNGKGSVSATLANILQAAGYKTGLYTSPHIFEYTERIKINNIQIKKQIFADYISKICDISEKAKADLTEFEILTVAAFKYFYDNKTDIAIIETGLGGRFDATNIIKKPILSIITSISLDHMDRLGNTIEEIAYEKAGIIKESSPVIILNNNKGINTILNIAKEKKSKVIKANDNVEIKWENNRNFIIYNKKEYEFPLCGLYQKKNLSLIFQAIEYLKNDGYTIKEGDLKTGLKTVKWNARFEYIKNKNLLIDGAHNPDAAFELKKSLDYYFNGEKRIFIYSTLNTKDYKTIANILFNSDDKVFYLEFNHKNAVTFEEYSKNVQFPKHLKKLSFDKLSDVMNMQNLKIVTGSLYMIGEYYKILKN